MSEQDFFNGERAMLLRLIRFTLKEAKLDQYPPMQWLLERTGCVQQLRILCAKFGSNNWEDNEYLADVIEKHLGRHLHVVEALTGAHAAAMQRVVHVEKILRVNIQSPACSSGHPGMVLIPKAVIGELLDALKDCRIAHEEPPPHPSSQEPTR